MKQKKTMSKSERKKTTVTLVALQDTQLADSTFVRKGEEVEVDASYAERALSKKDPHFVVKK
jgi:hypothetical protein